MTIHYLTIPDIQLKMKVDYSESNEHKKPTNQNALVGQNLDSLKN